MTDNQPPPLLVRERKAIVTRVQMLRSMHFQTLGSVHRSVSATDDIRLFRGVSGIVVMRVDDPHNWETIPEANLGLVKETHGPDHEPADQGIPKKKPVPNRRPKVRRQPDTGAKDNVPPPLPIQSGTFGEKSRKDTPWSRGGPTRGGE